MPNNRKVVPAYGRILKGIGLMGYNGPAALMDIVDNCIEAKAKKINIYFEQDESLKTKSRLSSIIVEDDGIGMDKDQMFNALQLGSPESEGCYSENSLSKFGFGLKSAGFSVAKKITIISRKSHLDEWEKSYISYDDILDTNEWNIYEDEKLNDCEKMYTDNKKDKGTFIFLNDMQPIFTEKKKDTFVNNICKAAALTFGSLLNQFEIYVDGNKIELDDPLFWDEAVDYIEDYDGTKPCRFRKDIPTAPLGITTIKGKKVTIGAKIKAVQLPNLHAFSSSEWNGKDGVKNKYKMTAEREGIYIYRNNRLIAEHTTLGLFNKNDTDYMSLRIRIDVDSDADDLVSLDVKKKTIQFSDSAMKEIADIVNPIIKKSREIWDNMKKNVEGQTPVMSEEDERHERSNKELAKKFESVTNPEDNSVISVIIPEADSEEIEKKYGVNAKLMQELNKKNISKISNVAYIEKNMLWEPAYTSTEGTIVVLSRQHPFYDRVYSKLEPNSDEVVILDALFLALASAEQNILLLDKEKEDLFVKLFKKMRATGSQNLETFLDFDFDGDEDDEK